MSGCAWKAIGLGGCGGSDARGCNCGCQKCRYYAWTSFMRSVLDAQGLGHHPSCPTLGVGAVECTEVPDVLNVMVVDRTVDRGSCGCVPLEEPGGCPPKSDCRGGGCSDVMASLVGVGEAMDERLLGGVTFGGRPVQGFAAAPSQGLAAPFAVPGWRQIPAFSAAPFAADPFANVPAQAMPGGSSFPPGTFWQQLTRNGVTYGRATLSDGSGTYYFQWVGQQLQPTNPPARQYVARQAQRNLFLAAPPGLQQLGLGATAATATNPSTVGLVAALGGAVGLIVGGALGSEIGSGTGEAAVRRAAVGGLMGMLVGSFAGAAITAPSVAGQTGA